MTSSRKYHVPISNPLKPSLHPCLQEFVGYRLSKTAYKLRFLIDEKIEPYGVIAPQFGILNILKNYPSLKQSELCSLMSVDKASMVRLLKSLEDLKYIVRKKSKADLREWHLSLTAKGTKACDEMLKIRAEVEDLFLSKLSKKQKEDFMETLSVLMTE